MSTQNKFAFFISSQAVFAFMVLSTSAIAALTAAPELPVSTQTENKPMETEQPKESNHLRAWNIALGTAEGSPDARRLRGAENDYNAKGNGSTMARRVLRGGSWEWVSAPASKGRFLAADRKDVQYGDVYEGEIVAQYTLGGSRTPDKFYLVTTNEKPLKSLTATKTKTGYRLSLCEGAEEITVTNPYWR